MIISFFSDCEFLASCCIGLIFSQTAELTSAGLLLEPGKYHLEEQPPNLVFTIPILSEDLLIYLNNK